MAEGGAVEHFCNQNLPHQSDCQYFAEGGFVSDADFKPDTAPTASADFIPDSKFTPDATDENSAEGQANREAQQEEALQSKYGGTGQQAIAGLESAASSATFGLSKGVERAFGVKPEDIRGREEANPVTSTLGTVAGLVNPFSVEGKALTMAGEAVAKHVVGEGILKGATKGMAKIATENALFQSGDEVGKMLTSDPNQSLGSAISNIGLSAVIGGVAGGALGAVSPLWKATVGEKASQFVSDFKGRLREHLELPPEVPQVEEMSMEKPTKTKTTIDPFTKEPMEVMETAKPKLSPNFDPFTKETISKETAATLPTETLKIVPEVRPKPQIPGEEMKLSAGQRVADMFVQKGAESAGQAIGGTIGHHLMAGIPFVGTYVGAKIGDKILTPFFQSALPAIARAIMDKGVSAEGAKVAVDYAMAVAKGQKLATDAAKNIFKTGVKVLPDHLWPNTKSREKLDGAVSRYQKDPTQMASLGGALGHYMPDHAVALGAQTTKIVSFLNSIKPKDTPRAPLDKPIPMSAVATAQYNRALDIADKPLIVLDAIKNGTLTSNDIQAMQGMYPELYQGLQQKVTEQMVSHVAKGETVPYDQRMSLSLFLGQPLDSTMNPQAILGAQPMPNAQPNAPQAPQSKSLATNKGNALSKGAKSSQTPLQASNAMHSTGKA